MVQLDNSGLSKSAALERERIKISRSQFSRKRCIAEAAKVDLPGVQHVLLHRELHAFWLKGGGADAPLGFAKGGHFEVKEGHPDFLQIS